MVDSEDDSTKLGLFQFNTYVTCPVQKCFPLLIDHTHGHWTMLCKVCVYRYSMITTLSSWYFLLQY
jgi:hypothetical protein